LGLKRPEQNQELAKTSIAVKIQQTEHPRHNMASLHAREKSGSRAIMPWAFPYVRPPL
jgi:hypothetical protein